MSDVFGVSRSRIAWLGMTAVVAFILGSFIYAFVGTFVLGLFFYYAVRPIERRLDERLHSRAVSATVTLLFVVIPGILLVAYVVLVSIGEFTTFASPELLSAVETRLPIADLQKSALEDPIEFVQQLQTVDGIGDYVLTGIGAIGTLANALFHLTLSSAFAFFLLRDGHRLDEWFRESVGGADSAAYTFVRTVDAELEQVYSGNVLTVCIVTVSAIVFYNGFNVLSPQPVQLPAPTLLAILTGIATFIPLVVGKVVYVPAGTYLLWQASQVTPSPWWAPILFLVVAFLFLDLVPMTFLLPLISGRSLHTGLVMFSYVLGGAFFGWYGLFLGPLLAVVVVHFGKIVLPEVIAGDEVDPDDRSPITIGMAPKRESTASDGGPNVDDSGEIADDGGSDATDPASAGSGGK